MRVHLRCRSLPPGLMFRRAVLSVAPWVWLVSLAVGMAVPAVADLRITEFMAENDGFLHDQDGDSPDWIEIHNDSFAPADLGGWHLTDSAANLTRWTFPATNLAAGDYLVVYASGKDRAVPGAELHTNFQLDNQGQFLALVAPDGVTVAHAYAPAFPPQRAKASFGIAREVTTTTLVAAGANARCLVPTNEAAGVAWRFTGFDDSAWLPVTTGVGFEAGTIGSTNAEGRVVLSVDFNDDDSGELGAANTETGFTPMALSGNPSTINGVTVTLSLLSGVGLDDRDRTTPVDNSPAFTQDQLYDDFIFVNGQTNGNGLRIRLTGLTPNQDYQIVIWSFDSGSGGARVSDWIETASGTTNVIKRGYSFDGTMLPTQNGDSTMTALVRSSPAGVLQIEGRRSGGTSHSVFLNALRLTELGLRSLIATDVGAAMSNRNSSAYLRLPFHVADPATVPILKLRMKYDDGFVAYLNGQEIAARNAPVAPVWNSAATAAHPASLASVFEEIVLTNAGGLLFSGANLLAIQGLNLSSADSDFLVLPELVGEKVDELANYYFVPATPGAPNAAGYLDFVADTKFSVNRGFFDTPFSLSITCATAGAEIWFTTNGSAPAPGRGWQYTAPILIAGQSCIRAAAFKDGWIPTDVDTHTYLFLREVLQQPASLPGYPATWQASYSADYAMDTNVVNHPVYGQSLSNDLRAIPTLSLVTDHLGLWHSSTGIYPNATSVHNPDAGQNWERAASAELINPDGSTAFAVNCGLRMHGNASRDNNRTPKHSFRLLFKSGYGPAKLRYDWFPGSPVREFDNIVLKAGFCDSWATRYSDSTVIPGGMGTRYRPEDSIYLRDVWMKDMQLGMGWHSARSQFVHLYINGLYWGLYNPSERVDASHFAEHFGGREMDWDVLCGDAVYDYATLKDGTKDDWNQVMALVNAGITNETAYQAVQQRVDVDNLIDFMLLHFHAEAEDWPHHNWYVAHRRATNSLPETQWLFAVWDQEIVFDQLVTRNRIEVNNADTPARIYGALRAWPEFRVRFGDRVQKHLFNSGALTPSNCVAGLEVRAAEIANALVGESARWGDAREFATPNNPATGKTFTRDEYWVPELQKLYTNWFPRQQGITLARLRNASLYPALGAPDFSQFGGHVPADFALAITHTNPAGTIFLTLDGTDPRVYGSGAVAPTAQAYDAPVPLIAPTLVRARVKNGSAWSALVEAMFYPPQDLSRLALTEIMFNPPAEGGIDGDEYEFLELQNTGTNELNLSGLVFTAGISFTFTNGTRLAPGAFVVLVRNAAAFADRYPGVAVGGVYSGRLANEGERIALSHPFGGTVLSVTYDDVAPWPIPPDGLGFSLVNREPPNAPAPDTGTKWRASALPGGSPGADDPPSGIAPIVINEVLSASVAPLLDSIELFNPTATQVDLGGWFLTDDPNGPRKFRLPEGTVIAAQGYATFGELDFNATPGSNGSFALNANGDDVYLFSADAQTNLTGYSHGFSFGAAEPGVSFGRYITSVGEEHFPAQLARSANNPNAGPRVGPVVINEIHYHPEVGGAEFIELRNVSAEAVCLFDLLHPENTWRLSGLNYVFPTNVVMEADAFLLLVATNPAAFAAQYQVSAGVTILGPYAGVLQDSGERLSLQRPDAPSTNAPAYITVDEVRYNDKSPWPPAADGAGASLQRIASAQYGDDPINWQSAAPTPGRENDVVEVDSDGDGLPDAWELLTGTNPWLPDGQVDSDGDGSNNLQEYFAGTNPFDGNSRLAFERITCDAGTVSLHINAVSNRTYSVLYANSLATPAWSSLASVPARSTNAAVIIADIPSVPGQRFYRLVAPAQP